MHTDDVRRGSQRLAGLLLNQVERIAARSAARMQESLPSCAGAPRHELTAVVVAEVRNLLEAIRGPDPDGSRPWDRFQASGQARAREGMTSDELLHAWGIGLETVREEAHAVAEELGIGTDTLLEFVEATLRWGDMAMRASASAHQETEILELRRLVEEHTALRRIATILARESSAEEVFAKVAEQVALLLGVEFAAINRYEPDGSATVAGLWGDVGDAFGVGDRLELKEDSVTTWVRRTQRPVRVDASERAGSIATLTPQAGMRSAIGAPILVNGRPWGALVAATSRADPIPDGAESRIAEFAELAATATSNVQAQAEVERLAEEQAALRRVATMVANGCSPEEAFVKVAEEVGLLLGADSAAIQRYEPEGDATVVGNWGKLGEAFRIGSRLTLDGDSIIALVYRTGRPVRIDRYDDASGSAVARARAVGLRSGAGSPIVVDGRLWGVMGVATSRAEPLPVDAESRIAEFTELVGTAMSNAQARSDLERLAEEQAALRRVATMVARESSAEEIFAQVAEEVGRLLGGESAVIERYEPEEHATVVGSWARLGDAVPVGRRSKLDGDSASALVYRTQRPARVDASEDASASIAATERKMGDRSGVASPIVVDGRVWGSLATRTSRAAPLPADAERRIAKFTELVATAISNLQARSDLAASRARVVTAADEERHRVVRDLHDGAQARLVHTIMVLKMARGALERYGEDAAALVDEPLQHAQTANDELRELAHGILPGILTDQGLRAGVRSLASRMSIPVEVDVSVDRLPGAVEATAYFTVAEALTNVAKHAGAQRATVRAHLESRTLQIEVRDDGAGGARADGTGLVGLSDRLALLDGTLRVESPAHGGTVIAASIPVR